MKTSIPTLLCALAIAGLFLAGCGSEPEAAPLDGRDFLSTAVSQDGQPRQMVRDTRISLGFDSGAMAASAGCNIMSGPYRVDGGLLIVEDLAVTEMGCEPDLQAQDEWLIAFFLGQPQLTLADAQLTMATDDTTIEFVDREVAEPDLPLVGPLWTVDSLISVDSVSSLPAGASASLRFDEGGRFTVETGCNSGGGGFSAENGTLVLTDMFITERACDGAPDQLEQAVLAVLLAESITYAVDGQQLTLTAGEAGLILRGPTS
jgi:heat shock protein HslJ